MSEETNWTRVYTGSDFSASLLKAEIEELGIEVKMNSDKNAVLHAGFGSSGFAQVLVPNSDAEKVIDLLEAFKEKMS